MPKPELIDAFDVEQADTNARNNFNRQALLLAGFAALVYPNEKERSEQKTVADARRLFRRHRPWYKCLAAESGEDKKYRKLWHQAASAFNEKSEQRIEQEVSQLLPAEPDVKFFNSYGTQCFVATTSKEVFVCFRGTEPDQWRDIVSDLVSIQTKLASSEARIHIGFAEALRQVWGNADETGSVNNADNADQLPTYVKGKMDHNERTLWITGHSLGGALATLAADKLIRDGMSADKIGGVFTFGQPRVGDGEFTNEYQLKDLHFRFVNSNDVVTRAPPQNLVVLFSIIKALAGFGSKQDEASKQGWKLIYRDVGNVVFIDRSGGLQYLKQDSSELKRKLFWGRTVSRFRAPFTAMQDRSFIKRFLPGLDDHRMGEYKRLLEPAVPTEAQTPTAVNPAP